MKVIAALIILAALASSCSEAPERIIHQPVYIDSGPNCEEDEGWIPVDYRAAEGVEDVRGVTRMCISLDTYVSWEIEVAIQDGILEYVGG